MPGSYGKQQNEICLVIAKKSIKQFEVLRLFPPVPVIPKWTDDHEQDITVGSHQYRIPPKTLVCVNVMALHTDPQTWGADSLQFRPSRWILSSRKRAAVDTGSMRDELETILDDETLFRPGKGTYTPWSGGPRICPGKDLAQVQFIAILSSLLKNHRVAGVPTDPKEGDESIQSRLLQAMEDSHEIISLQMRSNPLVRWIKITDD